MTLADVAAGRSVTIEQVGGERSFRRRLLEFGLLPGTRVTVTGFAPFRGPLTLVVRGCCLSIRASEARCVSVVEESQELTATSASPVADASIATGDLLRAG